MSPQQFCFLSDNSVATFPVTSGKILKVSSMRLTRARAGSREDPLMLLLFSLGQHAALRAVQRQLLLGELVFAYLDDIQGFSCVQLAASGTVDTLESGCTMARQVWNKSVVRPRGCDIIDRAAQATDFEFTTVWRGSALPMQIQSGSWQKRKQAQKGRGPPRGQERGANTQISDLEHGHAKS